MVTIAPASQTTSKTTSPKNDVDPRQKAFRPYGNAKKALYDKSPIVGICGPAGSGKSRLVVEKLHLIAEKYPGARILIARKTRESLTQAALVTYEDKVLPEAHPINPSNITRSHRQQYLYPNGSVIIVCGLDKPQKVMSTEYDIIYIQEATEAEQEDIEMLTTRLRNGVVPYQQLIFDCNPDKPSHWIWQGFLKGKWPLHQSLHEDNPTLWEEAPYVLTESNDEFPCQASDGRIGRWTANGERYINVLENLTGPRYHRLRHGRWVGSEGTVYDTFDLHKHTYDESKCPWGGGLPPRHWRRIWVVDFGYTHPMVVQKWTFDSDGRMYMYREHYHTKMLVEDMAKEVLYDAGYEYSEQTGMLPISTDNIDTLPLEIICDHDAEDRATFERYIGIRTTNAIKNISGGIQAVKRRLLQASDGRPRIFFHSDALYKKDTDLERNMKPFSTVQEFDGYVWGTEIKIGDNSKRSELPAPKQSDHGMDVIRYVVAYEDGIIDDELKAADVIMNACAIPEAMVIGIPAKREHYIPGSNLIGRTQSSQPGQSQKDKARFARRTKHIQRSGTNEWNPSIGNYGR